MCTSHENVKGGELVINTLTQKPDTKNKRGGNTRQSFFEINAVLLRNVMQTILRDFAVHLRWKAVKITDNCFRYGVDHQRMFRPTIGGHQSWNHRKHFSQVVRPALTGSDQ